MFDILCRILLFTFHIVVLHILDYWKTLDNVKIWIETLEDFKQGPYNQWDMLYVCMIQ